MSRPTGRGKIAAKLAASANQNGQEMNGDRDEWNIVQNPQKGLQDEWTTTTGNTEKTNGDDSWGTGGFTGAWGTDASSAGQTTTNTSYPATSEPECRHCEGPHLSSECPERRNGSGGGGGGGGGGRGCFNCGSTDHIKRDCPQNRGDRSYGENRSYGGGRSQGGYGSPEGQRSFGGNRSYGEGRSQGGFRSPEGQRSYGRDRSYGNERSPGDSNSYRNDTNCSNCGGRGHNASKCPSPPERGYDSAYGGSQSSRNSGPSQQSEISCYRCQETGHLAHQCPKRVGALTNTENTGPSMRIVETTEAEAENRNCIGDMSRFEGTQVKVLDSSGEQITKFNGKVLNSFRDGGLCETLLEMLDKLGFEKPMPVQKYAIPILAEGYDIMACAQTGSGKTAAFILPIVNDLIRDRRIADKGLPQRPYGLVLSPTRELCAQITKDAQQYCLRTCPKIKVKECYGGVSIFQQKRNIMEGCHLLVGTTGRTKQFIRDNVISLSELRYLVLDEADRMLDMGFHADVTDILRYRSQENPLQTLMFSATFPEDVQSLARECLKPDFVKLDVGIVGMVNKDVKQAIEQVSGMDAKQDRLQEIIEEDIRNDKRAKILVFTSTKLCADMLAIYLSGAGVKTTSMHGDRYQEQREKALDDFQNGTCPVLVATEVAGRGLDITDVTHVINFDLPKDLDGYVHRVGRTARAGKTGRATSFFDPNKDQHIQERLRQLLVDAGAVPPPFL